MAGTLTPEYRRAYYAKNRERLAKAQRVKSNRRRQEAQDLIRAYKADKGCVDCGERDWVVLDLDHRDRSTKRAAVSEMITQNFGLDAIRAELEKCDVRCANCHRRKTFLNKDFTPS